MLINDNSRGVRTNSIRIPPQHTSKAVINKVGGFESQLNAQAALNRAPNVNMFAGEIPDEPGSDDETDPISEKSLIAMRDH